MIKKVVPPLILISCLGLGSSVAQGASKPSMTVQGSFDRHDGNVKNVASFSLSFFSKRSFNVPEKDVDRVMARYRPTRVVLHVKGRKIKMNKIGEAWFLFGYFAPVKITGLNYNANLKARVTFRNKARSGTQKLSVTLKHE